MEEPRLIRLNLHAPIEYDPAPAAAPFPPAEMPGDEDREYIFCFELDPAQAVSIDPSPGAFPGRPLFSGTRGGIPGTTAGIPGTTGGIPGTTAGEPSSRKAVLPAGRYAFMQRRGVTDRRQCVELAVELQKDSLWERLRPENLLYVRFLFEDGSPVTQLFRPCAGTDL